MIWAGKQFGKLQHVLVAGAAEGIDGLELVTHDGDVMCRVVINFTICACSLFVS